MLYVTRRLHRDSPALVNVYQDLMADIARIISTTALAYRVDLMVRKHSYFDLFNLSSTYDSWYIAQQQFVRSILIH